MVVCCICIIARSKNTKRVRADLAAGTDQNCFGLYHKQNHRNSSDVRNSIQCTNSFCKKGLCAMVAVTTMFGVYEFYNFISHGCALCKTRA